MRSLLAFVPLLAAVAVAAPPGVVDPDLPDGTRKAKQQIPTFSVPKGMKVELFAAEPQLASPVAIGVDEKNRVFVAEEFRFNRGTQENRSNAALPTEFFLQDDLQVRTLDDRKKMFEKWAHKFPGGMDWYTKFSDQVRLLEDTNGDGKADKSTVFANGFNGVLDGLAAGVMATDGDVYLACIPNLWRLRDTDGDGKADERTKLLTGFGVNVAFLGHDLHGLTWGPDGKLYFTVGDRGFDVTSKEGVRTTNPRNGAVFRCDPDGSNFEVVMRGLRNPQELAFDQYGNLFADDNNCDKGDHGRLVYVVEGGDAGWNMAYQTIPAPYMGGPWFAERLWHLPHAGQAAYLLPPVGKIGTGPGGFLFTSGTSLPDRYRNAFIMCNFTGNGGLEAFKVKPKGAGFEIDDYHDFLKPIRATDAEFGYDGKLYVSDFVNLDWTGKTMGGRVYTAFDPAKVSSTEVLETKKLFAEGFGKRTTEELLELLGHADQRVRLRAQFLLAKKGADAELGKLARTSTNQLVRIHAIWGLGVHSRRKSDAIGRVGGVLEDPDAEVRAQAIRTFAEVTYNPKYLQVWEEDEFVDDVKTIHRLLQIDPSPRVRFFAAQTLGKLKHKPAISALFDVLAGNKDEDPFLRTACVVALARIGDADAVNAKAKDASPAVRMGVVLVQRRLADKRVAQFLADADPLVRTEAARAVHDLPMEDLYPQLAAQLPELLKQPIPDGDPLARRAISAAYRLGGEANAKAVLAVVTSPLFSAAVRGEALGALADWADPPPRDRVTGFWHPLNKRDPVEVRTVVEAGLTELLAMTSGKLQADAIAVIQKLNVKAETTTFAAWAKDAAKEPNIRVASLRFLAAKKAAELPAILTAALADSSPLLRAEARDLIADANAERGVGVLAGVLADPASTTAEKQRALAKLAAVKDDEAGAVLDWWSVKLASGRVPADLRLDVQDALKASPGPVRDRHRVAYEKSLPEGLPGKFVNALVGGDADRGREIFFGHTAAQCVRCHAIQKVGGTAGPDLTDVVKRNPDKTREHLLESLTHPNAKIAQGFATVSVTTIDGKVVAGTLVAEDKTTLTVQTPDGKKVAIPAADVDARTTPLSPMPSVERTLSANEMRDLIEFLATTK